MKEKALKIYLESCNIDFSKFIEFLKNEGCTFSKINNEYAYYVEDILLFLKLEILQLNSLSKA
jgi:hypothetical protein